MQVKAKAKYIRISPRKVRLVVDLVRGLDLPKAIDKLALVNKMAVKPVVKLLRSAEASAKHNYEIEANNLFIREIRVDEGPTLARWMPRAMGRATPIRKRSSSIILILAERVPSKMKSAKKGKKIETVKTEENVSGQVEEKVASNKKEALNQEAAAEHRDEKSVTKRMAGYRDTQQQVEPKAKKEKGIFKKMFRRKSGMS